MTARRALVLAAVLALVFVSRIAHAVPLGAELVVNGGAETGDTTGWTSTGVDAVPAVGFHAGFGAFTFTGGEGNPVQQLFQSISLAGSEAAIDAGTIGYDFSIQLQSRETDLATADVRFLSATSIPLLSLTFADPDTLVGDYDWNAFSSSAGVPVGTRSVEITLTASRIVGLSSDAFFDEVSLQLNGPAMGVPEPATLLLLGGVAVLMLGRRRL